MSIYDGKIFDQTTARPLELSNSLKRRFFPLLVLLSALGVIWLFVVCYWPVGFWRSGDEYAYLALAHAIHFEATLREWVRFNDSGLENHPGVPLYILSWICLRVSALFTSGGKDLISWVLSHPEPFYLSTRIASALISALTVSSAYFILAPLAPWKRALAISTFYAADPWAIFYGLTSISNETFALPAVTLLFWIVKKTGEQHRGLRFWVGAGAVSAFAYLVKLTYLSVPFGVGITTIVASIIEQKNSRWEQMQTLCIRLSVVAAAFVFVTVSTLLIFDGWASFRSLLITHAAFVLKGASAASSGVHNSYSDLSLPLILSMLAASTTLVYRLLSRNFHRVWDVVAICSFALSVAVVLGNFTPRYVPAIAAFLPFMWRFSLEKKAGYAVCVFTTIISAFLTFHLAKSDLRDTFIAMEATKSDESAIEQLPISEGEARLWTYTISSEKFVREFVLQLAGLQDYLHAREAPSKDYSSFQRVDRRYRYVILEKSRHPINPDGTILSFTDPDGMVIRLNRASAILQLKKTTVVELR